jgi:uncharacterized lipoprotein YddW (UPF0748 family)
MTASSGVEFEFRCPDQDPISYFSLYLQSGGGWYHAAFYPEPEAGWHTVRVMKSQMKGEGTPAGWSQVRSVRLSAWKGRDRNTQFEIRNLRLIGVPGKDASVVIVRGDHVGRIRPTEAKSVDDYTSGMAEQLDQLGLGCLILSDLELSMERIQAARVVILPHNPVLPEGASRLLETYMVRGGKLLVFYSVPAGLHQALGVTEGRHVRESAPGFFSHMRALPGALNGAPPRVGQRSWNIHEVLPAGGRGRVLAEWLDAQGNPNGLPAVVGSARGLVMTHVLLADDPVRKRQWLLALLGSLNPDLWKTAVEHALAGAGKIGRWTNLVAAAAEVAAHPGRSGPAREALSEVEKALGETRLLLAAGKPSEALAMAALATERLRRAYCLMQTSRSNEFRAFWCHQAYGVDGLSWDQALERLATNGFTAIFPNQLWGGLAFYPSRVLPVSREVARRGDAVAQCLEAARKYGLQMHVWKVNWNLGGNVPVEFRDRLARENRLQKGRDGSGQPWLCPSHPANQRLEVDSMVELAQRYDLDGIHFDYIRYPDGSHCFCSGCRTRFEKLVGSPLKEWPKEVLEPGKLRHQWLDWRRSHITTVVRQVSEQARSVRPGIKISAAVFPNWAADRDSVAQDWKLWCEKGWVDFVCPMDYTESRGRFANLVSRQKEWVGRTPFYPGIGVSASSSRLPIEEVIEQIEVTRRQGTGGFIIFNYGSAEAAEIVPLLGLGETRRNGAGPVSVR